MTARLLSWSASAAQLREIFVSTADWRAEFLGCAPVVCIQQHRPGIGRLKAFCPHLPDFIGPAYLFEGNMFTLNGSPVNGRLQSKLIQTVRDPGQGLGAD